MGKPRSAVFLAKVPKSFKPAHIHSQPDEILGGKYLARRLSIANAVAFANAYNRTHLPSEGTYRHKWAIAIAGLDRLYDHQHGSRRPAPPTVRSHSSIERVKPAETEGGAQ